MPRVSEAALIRSVCRESYEDFVKEFWDTVTPEPLHWNWHLSYLCGRVQELVENLMAGRPRLFDLVTCCPPGTSKSTIFSVMLAPWLWTRMPHACVLGASYSEQVALMLAVKCRDVVRSDKYRACFPEVQIRADQDRKGNFATTAGGMRFSVGSGSVVIGLHFHVHVLDDPIDALGAVSRAEMDTTNYWIENQLGTRFKDPVLGLTLLVSQRLALDDPAGKMMNRTGVEKVVLPATTEFPIHPPELAANYVDGLLDPVRRPRAYLDRVRDPRNLGEAGYAAQFGQSPVALGGGKFDTAKLVWGPVPQEFKRLCRGWDKAVTPKKGAGLGRQPDFTVGTLVGIDRADRAWVLDVQRFQLGSFDREEKIKRVARNDGGGVIIAVEQEPGSSGEDSAQATARRLLGYRVRLIKASGSKEARADDFSYALNAGTVYLPDRLRLGNGWQGWAVEWVQELRHFPGGPHDDQVDSVSLAYSQVSKAKIRVGPILARR